MRFVPNRNVARQLANADEMGRMLGSVVEPIAQMARSIAPVGDEPGETRYRDTIQAEVGREAEGYIGRVNANDPASVYIEFGTEDTPTFAPLRRAVQAQGLRLERR